jgi:DNA-binding response OmpR family regulator
MVRTVSPNTLAESDRQGGNSREVANHNSKASCSGSVLIIEDDLDIAEVIRIHLENAQFRATVANDGRFGLELALRESPDLVVLDLNLPGQDGLDICKVLTERVPRPLILIVTARCAEGERVAGLELGADDYLAKPFSILELVARVRALFRRPPLAAQVLNRDEAHVIGAGGLLLDRWEKCARLNGVTIALTAREFDLLLWFARHPNRVFSRTELLDSVWGGGYDGFEHTVNSHLNRLRAKLEHDTSHPAILITVRGGGYKLVPPQDATTHGNP